MEKFVTFKRYRWKLIGLLFLAVLFVSIVLVASGCVRGLTPVGWSGGAVSGDNLYVGSTEGRLVVVNLMDESRQWAEQMSTASQGGLGCSFFPSAGGGCASAAGVAIYGTPVVSGELVYAAGYNGKIYAYNVDSLAVRWVYPREGYLKPFVGGIAVSNGKLYIGSTNGIMYALDAQTGDFLWEFETEKEIWATPAVDEDTVYFGSFDEKFYAVNTSDGSKRWEFTAEGAIAATPLINEDIIYVGSLDKNLYALNTDSGSLKWQFTGKNWFWALPVLYGGNIYAGCMDNRVYILNAETGNKVNELDLGNPVASSPVVIGNSVIFASKEGVVFSIDTSSGSLKILAEFEEQDINGPLTGYDDIVYIHTQDKKLKRINVVNGSILRDIDLAMP
jgi:outer membrane protein assembly factor BamB